MDTIPSMYSIKLNYLIQLIKRFTFQVQKYPLPSLEGNVEVEVKYCGLNFADLYTRLGLIPKEVPFVLGIECTGIITKIGDKTDTTLNVIYLNN